jgi:hypothetical protein
VRQFSAGLRFPEGGATPAKQIAPGDGLWTRLLLVFSRNLEEKENSEIPINIKSGLREQST